MSTKVGIVGATGYNGLELIRILLRHREAEIAYLATRSEETPAISQVHPALLGLCDNRTEPIDLDRICERCDAVFLGVPHTAAMEIVPGILAGRKRVIDLSADYRLKSAEAYAKWYGHEHTDPANLARAVYGLPELFPEKIGKAQLVANPGCYPTAVVLGAYPLIAEGLVAPGFIADAKSGVTGAGRKLTQTTHFPEANESVLPYKVGAHQHSPEMVQALSQATGRKVQVEFVAHLVPMDRGIEATMYFEPSGAVTTRDVAGALERHYSAEPFIRLRGPVFARTRDVAYTNFCDIAWTVTDRHVIVSASIDNILKGAAGQAVENMNLMFGHDRTEGLS